MFVQTFIFLFLSINFETSYKTGSTHQSGVHGFNIKLNTIWLHDAWKFRQFGLFSSYESKTTITKSKITVDFRKNKHNRVLWRRTFRHTDGRTVFILLSENNDHDIESTVDCWYHWVKTTTTISKVQLTVGIIKWTLAISIAANSNSTFLLQVTIEEEKHFVSVFLFKPYTCRS